MSMKTTVSPHDAIEIAYWSIVRDLTQTDIGQILKISNAGRVAEAVMAMRYAAENIDQVYRLARQAKAKAKVDKA